ncbi:ATP-dependent RNA helicase RhlE [Desulfomicrobium apsheronum]|uniref:ATP-dependent RNA helicase RhlE n=1 Tax=Desulfomicrobium apsheronum TaxID=52560 RepID=A0A1I3YX18_9BACT|nr:DEAD/DEAH box helicase [Desulfomicrobium apsheronum]SFK36388.1 ATP-dependent RNA helicase RhlE [Desulfomicrobium apsheronum]
MSFDQLGLRVELLKAVKNKGYEAPTAIQAQAIPVIISGRDILARAQTGTGKTDAFGLPIVQILGQTRGNGHHPRALILTPTRELALQVGESIKAYARKVSLRCTVAFGGVRIEPQIARLERGIDILVATPGRLIDLATQEHLNLAAIEFLVFDEADRMLDLGFSGEINTILDLLPKDRRTMLFSATYTPQIKALAARMLNKPEYIEVTPDTAAAEAVVQKVHMVNKDNKLPLLLHLIEKQNQDRILVFARTRTWANRLTDKLAAHGISVAALHGSKSQSLRKRTLEEFKDGKIHILVATDVAARGLDISNLPFVVNYDIPNSPEDYVHRIGRTGRAGVSGIAVSLVSPEEHNLLLAIENLLRNKIPVEAVKGFTEDSDLPDFVLYRPGNMKSERNAPREIKALVTKKSDAKLRVKSGSSKKSDSDKDSGSKSKPRGARNEKPDAKGGSGTGAKPESSARGRRSDKPDARGKSGADSKPESKGRGRRNERSEDPGASRRGGNSRSGRPDSRPSQPTRGRSRGRG